MVVRSPVTNFAFFQVVLTIICLQVASHHSSAADSQASLHGLRLLDLSGERYQVGDDQQPSVFIFLSTECPICTQYVPELNRIADRYADEPVHFYGVVSDAVQTRQEVIEFQKAFETKFPVLFDDSGELAERLKPTHTPEAFVLDGDGVVVYRGRIDDLYPDVGKKRPKVTSRDLDVAMQAVLSHESVPVSYAEPVGCRFRRELGSEGTGDVTFTRHIAPIVYAHCTECHRPGEVAPFSLISYEDVAKRAEWIQEVIESELMPPWRAAEGYGHFLSERRLTDRQRELIARWVKDGSPKGADEDMPALPEFPSGWALGEPDLILEAPYELTVPAEGPDIFHHVVLPIDLDEDQSVAAVEFRPGNPRVVHHAVILVDESGRGRELDEASPEPGYRTGGSPGVPLSGILTIWAPGVMPRPLPSDIAVKLPKNGDIILELHIHPSGKEETDRSRLGIYFSKKPAKRFVMKKPLIFGPIHIDIPAGAKEHRVSSSVTLPSDMTMTAILPHMHLLGKELKVWGTLPDGTDHPLIWIKDWNFNWQDQYVYRDPVDLPKGTTIHVEGRYDNSADNPFNPSSPPARVLFGEETTDEMCLAIFQSVSDDRHAGTRLRGRVLSTVARELADPSVDPEFRADILRKLNAVVAPELRSNPLARLLLSRPKPKSEQ